MDLFSLPIVIVAIGILWGTVTDLRTREVPDWVNYTLIASGFGFALMRSLHMFSFVPVLESGAGFAAGYALGALMYYTGQWGGGDAKLVMGVGALLGLPVTLAGWAAAPLLGLFLLFTMLCGAAYGLVWMAVLFVLRRKEIIPLWRERLHTPSLVRLRVAALVAAVLLGIVTYSLAEPLLIALLVLLALGYLTLHLGIIVKAVERVCFRVDKPPSRLVEGDWLVEPVVSGRRTVLPVRGERATAEILGRIREESGKRRKRVAVRRGVLLWRRRRTLDFDAVRVGDILAEPLMLGKRLPQGTRIDEDLRRSLMQASAKDALLPVLVRRAMFGEVRIAPDTVWKGDMFLEDVSAGTVLAGNFAEGLAKWEIDALKRAKVRSVRVKEGIPFVPSFLFAIALAVLWKARGYPLLPF